MKKPELVASIAETTEITKIQAGFAVDAIVQVISDTLQKGDKVVVPGFGTFEVKARAARTGRNPQTGEEIQIAAAKLPAFKAGKALKDAMQ